MTLIFQAECDTCGYASAPVSIYRHAIEWTVRHRLLNPDHVCKPKTKRVEESKP